MKKDIAIYGAGGLGREIACLIRRINQKEPVWNFIGFFDDGKNKAHKCDYGDILGNIDDLNLWPEPLAIAIAVGNPLAKKKIVENITNSKIHFPNIIAPDLIYLDESRVVLGRGNIICSQCLFSCNLVVGDFNLFNGYIAVGHDTHIGSFNVFMPSVNISGEVKIGNNNFMGVSSVVLQQIEIGNSVRVGAGSVIIRKTQDNNLYIGNPAIKMKF